MLKADKALRKQWRQEVDAVRNLPNAGELRQQIERTMRHRSELARRQALQEYALEKERRERQNERDQQHSSLPPVSVKHETRPAVAWINEPQTSYHTGESAGSRAISTKAKNNRALLPYLVQIKDITTSTTTPSSPPPARFESPQVVACSHHSLSPAERRASMLVRACARTGIPIEFNGQRRQPELVAVDSQLESISHVRNHIHAHDGKLQRRYSGLIPDSSEGEANVHPYDEMSSKQLFIGRSDHRLVPGLPSALQAVAKLEQANQWPLPDPDESLEQGASSGSALMEAELASDMLNAIYDVHTEDTPGMIAQRSYEQSHSQRTMLQQRGDITNDLPKADPSKTRQRMEAIRQKADQLYQRVRSALCDDESPKLHEQAQRESEYQRQRRASLEQRLAMSFVPTTFVTPQSNVAQMFEDQLKSATPGHGQTIRIRVPYEPTRTETFLPRDPGVDRSGSDPNTDAASLQISSSDMHDDLVPTELLLIQQGKRQ